MPRIAPAAAHRGPAANAIVRRFHPHALQDRLDVAPRARAEPAPERPPHLCIAHVAHDRVLERDVPPQTHGRDVGVVGVVVVVAPEAAGRRGTSAARATSIVRPLPGPAAPAASV